MSKKKIPEVRLLLDVESLFDMDKEPEQNQVLVVARLEEKELTVSAYNNGSVVQVNEVGGESKDYASLGVVVLSKRKHAKAIKELEHLRDTESTVAWSKAIIEGIIKGLSV